MIATIIKKIFKKGGQNTEFSRFIREASSRKKKKLFLDVLKKATADQKKILAR